MHLNYSDFFLWIIYIYIYIYKRNIFEKKKKYFFLNIKSETFGIDLEQKLFFKIFLLRLFKMAPN